MVKLLLAKAQAFSFDFLIACSIFLLMLFVFYTYWTYSYLEIEESRRMNKMIDSAYLVSQAWFREGTPKYWSPSDVIEVGLQNDHKFNRTKMDSLNKTLDPGNLGYDETKELINAEFYEYFFRVYNTTNDTVYSFGLYPSDAENVVKIKRIGIYRDPTLDEDSEVNLEVLLWE